MMTLALPVSGRWRKSANCNSAFSSDCKKRPTSPLRRSIGTSISSRGRLLEPDGPVTGLSFPEAEESDEAGVIGVELGCVSWLAWIVAWLELEEGRLALGDDSSIRRLPIEDETSETRREHFTKHLLATGITVESVQ